MLAPGPRMAVDQSMGQSSGGASQSRRGPPPAYSHTHTPAGLPWRGAGPRSPVRPSLLPSPHCLHFLECIPAWQRRARSVGLMLVAPEGVGIVPSTAAVPDTATHLELADGPPGEHLPVPHALQKSMLHHGSICRAPQLRDERIRPRNRASRLGMPTSLGDYGNRDPLGWKGRRELGALGQRALQSTPPVPRQAYSR